MHWQLRRRGGVRRKQSLVEDFSHHADVRTSRRAHKGKESERRAAGRNAKCKDSSKAGNDYYRPRLAVCSNRSVLKFFCCNMGLRRWWKFKSKEEINVHCIDHVTALNRNCRESDTHER
jgi:hypothetical protein